MQSGEGIESGRQFSGVNTWLMVRYLRAHDAPGAASRLLTEAGDTRTDDELFDLATWSSYAQFRRLLEVMAASFGGSGALERAAGSGLADPSMPEMTNALQSLGSPEALLSVITESGGASLAPIIALEGHAVGPTEWLLEERFLGGFEHFPEYCSWAAGLYANIPKLFGMRPEVEHIACVCHGAHVCQYRLRWFPDEPGAVTEFLESRIEVLTARLESLHATVGDLVSDDDLERVLAKIVTSAAHAMQAPIFVLALEALPSAPKNVYASGVDDDQATLLAAELLEVDENDDEHLIVVDVLSTQRRYGRLAAINPHGRFLPQECVVLEAYARLAAAALDSASALDDARRQARTARALLELSNDLAKLVTTDDMAANIVHALPAVIGCDRAAFALFEEDAPFGRVIATCGYSTSDEVRLRSMEVPVPARRAGDTAVTVWDRESAAHLNVLPMLMSELGAAAVATIPIFVNDEHIGLVVGDVVDRAERMIDDPELASRLRGVASQATIAIRNARLLEGMRHQALHDALTGLPNRTLILDRVEQMQARARRSGAETAALFLDLDGFKQVNDTLGHEAGDQLLKAVATRLHTTLREGDTIARLGGDEFVVLVEGATPTGSPEFVAERLLEVLREPFDIDDAARPSVRITASIGIARGNRISATDLLRDADIALYEAKAAGRDRYVTFRREMQAAVEDRLTLELDLRGALERDEYYLVYQPIFDLETGAVLGVEALLRWNHPVRGIVQPDAFIPLLEETKMIIEVGGWVIEEATRQAQEWRLGERDMYVSVNVSARQLDGDHLVRELQAALDATGLPPSSLIIELTETAIMYDATSTALQLRAVKEIGVGVAIDDFGTGYSSLAYLRQFPVDILKIDRSFVTAISDSVESSALIRTLVQLGKQLGLKTLAEGIEQHDQFCQLQEQQCDSGQGFMFARPLAADAVEDFLADLPRPAVPMHDAGSDPEADAAAIAPVTGFQRG
jgi:diguanylate cyclase (GGDEF)-like protein